MPYTSIGVVGGMGPAASSHFADSLEAIAGVEGSPEIIHMSNPDIPDRTEYLLGFGPDPVPDINQLIDDVDAADVDVITIPCNTAHAPGIFERLRSRKGTPIANIVEETAGFIALNHSSYEDVAILGTDGTRCAGTYEQTDTLDGRDIIYPDEAQQRRLMEMIYGIKQGGVKKEHGATLLEIIEGIDDAGVFVLACTELSLVYPQIKENPDGPRVVDSLDCLAKGVLGVERDQWPVLAAA